MHHRYASLLYIISSLLVLAVHSGISTLQIAWPIIEVFFILAGMHMVKSMHSSISTLSYAKSRIMRLIPEFICVYICCWLVFLWDGNRDFLLFNITAPLFLHNWMRSFYHFTNIHYFFWPLWFIGALLQAQVLLMAFRRLITRANPTVLLAGAILFNAAACGVYATLLGVSGGRLSIPMADAIYWTPFAHADALLLGYLIGAGHFQKLGRLMFPLLALTLVIGALNLWLAPDLGLRSLGIPFGMPANYQFIWGYPLMAIVAGSVVAPSSPLARWVQGLRLPRSADELLNTLGRLTYSVYVLHGAILGTIHLLLGTEFTISRFSLFLIIVISSWSLAWLFGYLRKGLSARAFVPRQT